MSIVMSIAAAGLQWQLPSETRLSLFRVVRQLGNGTDRRLSPVRITN
jgi:hypothetical protein